MGVPSSFPRTGLNFPLPSANPLPHFLHALPCSPAVLKRGTLYSHTGGPDLLGQVPRKDLPSVLPEILLEDGGQGNHWLASAQLGTLDHALLVVHEEVGAAGQDSPSLIYIRLGGPLCLEIAHKPVNKLAEVSKVKQEIKIGNKKAPIL